MADYPLVLSWDIYARQYLGRLAAAEYQAYVRKVPVRKRARYRYDPSDYHRALIERLNAGDEAGFKALKLLQGYASALGV